MIRKHCRRKYNALNAQSRDDRERNGDGAFAEARDILNREYSFHFKFPLVCFLYVSVTLFRTSLTIAH